MQTEIIITGLCVFLNPGGTNTTMGEPAVIAIRVDDDDHARHATTTTHAPTSVRHIPFIAYPVDEVTVSDPSGFQDVTGHPFRYLELDGVELSIANNPPATPTVDPSFKSNVVKKDDYWPAALNQWNRDFVPERGKKPKKHAVAMYMLFGKGTLKSGDLLDLEWRFDVAGARRGGPTVHQRRFARDVVYSGFPHSRDGVTITLTDLGTGKKLRTLTFAPKTEGGRVRLFVGNNTADDVDNAVRRTQSQTESLGNGAHFEFLNRVANPKLGRGPIPTPVRPAAAEPPVGGLSDGYCGPANGNGG